MKTKIQKYLIVIAGPTAVGKTKVAIEIAKYFDTDIISADSRQIFRELNIGVARPSEEELNTVKHYFIANKSIDEYVSAGTYECEVLELLNTLYQKKDIVVLCGGTGFYTNAVLNGFDEMPKVNPEIRSELNAIFRNEGIVPLQEKLKIYCSINGFYDDKNEFPVNLEILDYWENCNIRTKENTLVITDNRHKHYRQFYNSFFDIIAFDELKYKNFKFSIFRIIEFIDNKIEKKEPETIQTENNNEIIEDEILVDYNLQIKQKLILLNELGVIEFLNNKLLYKDNASHLAHILNAFLDTKTETLKGYVNFLLRPDNSKKNSPYNSNNRVNETLLILNQFKIKKD